MMIDISVSLLVMRKLVHVVSGNIHSSTVKLSEIYKFVNVSNCSLHKELAVISIVLFPKKKKKIPVSMKQQT